MNKSVFASRILTGLLLVLVGGLVLTAGAPFAQAQILYGTVVGNIADPSGAAIPAASIVLTNRQTNWTRQISSAADGSYTIPTVPGGIYELRVTLDGFRTYIKTDLNVATNAVVRADVVMQLGQVSEQIEVSAQGLTLQTDRAEVRTEVTRATLENVPVPPGRNYQQLFVTLPGFSQPRNAHSIPSNPSRAL